MRILIFCLLAGFLHYPTLAQHSPKLFVNEFNLGASERFIELVVLGDLSNPHQRNNFSGWIIDNNPLGPDEGFIQLGDCFQQVRTGAFILLYDQNNPPAGLSAANDGAPNALGIFQIPFNSVCLLRCHEQNLTTCHSDHPNIVDWSHAMGIDPKADLIQIIRPDQRLELAINWAGDGYVAARDEQSINVQPSGAHPQQITMGLKGNSGRDQLDCGLAVFQPEPLIISTAGDFNDPGNGEIINDIRSGSSPPQLELSCSAEDESSDALGAIHLRIQGGVPGYEVSWSPSLPGSSLTTQTEELTIPLLTSSTYTITVTDDRGCTTTCSATVEFPYEKSICKGACITIGTKEAGLCYLWTPDEGLALPHDQQIEVCPDTTTTYTQEILQDGRVVATRRYIVEVDPLDVYIYPKEALLCENGQVRLRAFPKGSAYSYEWSTGSQQQREVVTQSGIYYVTVSSEEGCSASAYVEVAE